MGTDLGGAALVVAMATYKRPRSLRALVPLVLEQLGNEGRVLVVDNDPEASGHDAALSTGDPRVHYVVEPLPGISSARNRILAEAAEASVLVMIDDDETPHKGWLAALLRTHQEWHADAVAGPVRAVFEGGSPDPWIAASGAYEEAEHRERVTGLPLQRAATNNLLLDMATIRRVGLRFDSRLGLSGGEDSLFTGQLTQAGGTIIWCAEAVVDDLVPAPRNNRRYNLRRRYATSSTSVHVDVLLSHSPPHRFARRIRWFVIGVGQIGKGAVLTFVGKGRRTLSTQAKGERRVASGLGVLAGCLGITASPYARRPAKTKEVIP